MADLLGKKFEMKFAEDFISTFKDGICERIPDQVSGYKGTSQNVCDFYCFANRLFYYIECKTTKDGTLNFSKFSQYERMLPRVGKSYVRVGVIIWFYNHDKIVYVPVSECEKMKRDGKKSISLKSILNKEYIGYVVPSVKKRKFFDSDYSFMGELKEKE